MGYPNLMIITTTLLLLGEHLSGIHSQNYNSQWKEGSPIYDEYPDGDLSTGPRLVRDAPEVDVPRGRSKPLDLLSVLNRHTYFQNAEEYQNTNLVEMDEDSPIFVDAVTKCLSRIRLCLRMPVDIHLCALSCILDAFAPARKIATLLPRLVRLLCNPITTVYDNTLDFILLHRQRFVRISQYYKLLGFSRENYKTMTDSATEALPYLLVKYGKNNFLDQLKPTVALLGTSLQHIVHSFNGGVDLTNQKCKDVDKTSGVFKLAQTFANFPHTLDFALGGWFTLSNFGYLGVTTPITEIAHSILHIIKALSGVQCSLIEYAETRRLTDCKNVYGRKPDLFMTTRVEPEPCRYVDLLPKLNLSTIYPDIFPITNKDPADTWYDAGTDE